MFDISDTYGADVDLASTGDLATVDGKTLVQQRLLRRLLTAPGTYIWHPDYGAGLPAYVGVAQSPAKLRELRAIVLQQIQQESGIARTPVPTVSLQSDNNNLYCQIQYTDALTNTPQTLSFTV